MVTTNDLFLFETNELEELLEHFYKIEEPNDALAQLIYDVHRGIDLHRIAEADQFLYSLNPNIDKKALH